MNGTVERSRKHRTKPISPARTAAYRVLCDVFINGAYSNESINSNFNPALKKPEDRALASNIIYGTIKKKNRLEMIIAALSKRSGRNVDERIKLILMMSLYQLFYLDKVPGYAVVNDAVEMTRLYGSPSYSGFVNAVLREALRRGDALIMREDDKKNLLANEYGFASWLIKLLSAQYGLGGLADIAAAFEKSPKVTLRVNTLRISEERLIDRLADSGISAAKTFVPGVITVEKAVNVFAGREYREGLFYAQDISGVISGYLAGVRAGCSVLDLCAAPGAKSFNAYILSGGSAFLTACDISASKVDAMRRAASQYGIPMRAMKSDASSFNPKFRGTFDIVICDVPCSGLGVIGRKPEILYRVTERSIEELKSKQLAILKNAVNYVKKGGCLVYSTCTINKEENEDIIARALSDIKGIRPAKISLPFELAVPHEEMKNGMLVLNPAKDNTDGFFTAVLTRSL